MNDHTQDVDTRNSVPKKTSEGAINRAVKELGFRPEDVKGLYINKSKGYINVSLYATNEKGHRLFLDGEPIEYAHEQEVHPFSTETINYKGEIITDSDFGCE